MQKVQIVIIGAGLSGLSSALALNRDDYVVLEASDRVGGLATTEVVDGCVFDITGHWLHLRQDRVKNLINTLLKDQLKSYIRRAYILFEGRLVNYPFQANLGDLPKEIAARLAIDAHRAACNRSGEPENFREFSEMYFGRGITELFIAPYNGKLWGVPIEEVTTAWCDRFVPIPDPEEIIKGAIIPRGQSLGYNVRFLYHPTKGIGVIAEAMAERLDPSRLLLNTPVIQIDEKRHIVKTGDKEFQYDYLINTIALKDLTAMLQSAPEQIKALGRLLRASRLVYAIGTVEGEELFDDAQWLYVPDEATPIYRFGIPSNVDRQLARPGVSSFYAEFRPDYQGSITETGNFIQKLLESGGYRRKVLSVHLRERPYGYVIFDKNRDQAVNGIMDYLQDNEIFSIGRFGRWTYNAMEDAIADGMDIVKRIRNGRT